ncbi:MAG TPA: sulfate/molybdate ABC transporter ATP-binding protein [Actinomycetota bacterium]|jgi:sulfate transport system ATP-binding protein
MSEGIVVEGLWKRFGSFEAVCDVSFEAEDGKITALLGPSGSGKSTVLRMIAGLERPDRGRIWVGGEEQTGKTVQERRFGFVFQHYALFRHMTVRQNVAFALAVRKQPKPAQRARVDELLELVGLAPFAGRYPDQLSGGQRQRVALARALAPQPRLLLLDEPFGALDARVRQELRRWLDGLHRELGVTSLLVTHDQEEALELANEVVVMHRGRIEQIGTTDEIYNRPATPFVAGFVGSANVLHGRVSKGRMWIGDAAALAAAGIGEGRRVRAYVRPHDVDLSAAAEDPAGDGALSAAVERVTDMGWTSKVLLRLPDGQSLVAQVPNERIDWVRDGARVVADLRKAKVFPTDGPDRVDGVDGTDGGGPPDAAADGPVLARV